MCKLALHCGQPYVDTDSSEYRWEEKHVHMAACRDRTPPTTVRLEYIICLLFLYLFPAGGDALLYILYNHLNMWGNTLARVTVKNIERTAT